MRHIEAVCDRIMRHIGSPEPLIPIAGAEWAVARMTMQWRKPLAIAEIAQLAPTPEVRQRPGRA